MRLEQQVGEQRRGLHLVGQLDEQAECQRVVDDGLADIQNAHAPPGEDGGQRVGDAGMIVAGDVDVKDAGLRLHGHGNIRLSRSGRFRAHATLRGPCHGWHSSSARLAHTHLIGRPVALQRSANPPHSRSLRCFGRAPKEDPSARIPAFRFPAFLPSCHLPTCLRASQHPCVLVVLALSVLAFLLCRCCVVALLPCCVSA